MRHGFSFAELLVGSVLLALALVPLHRLLVSGRIVATQSRLAYLALHAAREELEELRQLPFERLRGHNWEPVRGNTFRRTLATVAPGGAADGALGRDARLSYPAEYGRIRTRLSILATEPPDPTSRMKRAVLEVRWEENGPGTDRAREGTGHFESIVTNHDPEG